MDVIGELENDEDSNTGKTRLERRNESKLQRIDSESVVANTTCFDVARTGELGTQNSTRRMQREPRKPI